MHTRQVGRPRWVQNGYLLFAFLLVFYATSTIVRPDHRHIGWLDDGLTNVVQVGASLLCLVRAVLMEQRRRAWLAFGAGLLAWSLGDVYWAIAFGGGDAPGPSLADVGYLAFYPFAYIGLVDVIRDRARRFLPSLQWDGAIVGLAAASIAAAFAFDTIRSADRGSGFTVAVNLCYPIGDLILVALAAAMLTLLRGRLEIRWVLLAAGGLLIGLADTIYLLQTAHDAYVEGTVIDALWPAGILAMSYAGWLRPRRPRLVPADGPLLLAAPLTAATAAGAILVYGNVGHVGSVAVALAAASLTAAAARMVVGFHDLRRLNDTAVLAHIDDLTQLGNRRFFRDHLDALLAASPAASRPAAERLALLFIDLDKFKEVNDAFGHSVGDELLTQLGIRLRQRLRNSDILARLGGDEFGVLLFNADSDYALDVANRIADSLAEPFTLTSVTVPVGASIGIALAPEHGGTSEELLRCADVAMYRAKNSRTTIGVYDVATDTSLDRFHLLEELRQVIKERQLLVHYQPKINLATGTVSGVEALLRWPHPTRGLIPPDTFIPLAEDAQLMRPLTHFVLDAAIAQAAVWAEAGAAVAVAVNLSASNLLDDDLPAEVAALLSHHRVDPQLLTLEITETTLLLDPERAHSVIDELHQLVVFLSVDDFGTGYSSLAYLRDLPVDELKVDKSFVQAAGGTSSRRNAAILHSALTLGHGLNLRVVAEGVEDAATLQLLAHLGFDSAQGYYLGRPLAADDLDLQPRVVQPAASGRAMRHDVTP
jgi:diguanylate cyclase